MFSSTVDFSLYDITSNIDEHTYLNSIGILGNHRHFDDIIPVPNCAMILSLRPINEEFTS